MNEIAPYEKGHVYQFLIGTVTIKIRKRDDAIDCVSIPHRYGNTKPKERLVIDSYGVCVSIPHRYGN